MLEQPSLIDVGYGCPVELSSAPGNATLRSLLPGQYAGEAAFGTEYQERPWLIVDLGVVRAVKRVRIFNHDGAPERAIPLLIASSKDRENWHLIATVHVAFGGQRSEVPFEFTFLHLHHLRYLKLEVQRASHLHPEYIEISAQVPQPRYGRFLGVRVAPSAIVADYRHHESFGFAWTFTCTLIAICHSRHNGIHVGKVDYSLALERFKDSLTHDVYDDLFELAPELIPDLPYPPHFEHHGVYATFNFAVLRQYVAAYFSPSRTVRDLAAAWAARYRLDPERTVVMVYRGTDKSSEVQLAPIEHYIAVVRALRDRDPGLQVAIQTDQAEALQAALAAYPDAIHLHELPVTTGVTAVHNLPVADRFGITRTDLGRRLLAMTYLYSAARYVVSHTGNIGFWLALYRGRPQGFYQFDQAGKLRDPSGELLPLDLAPS